MFHKPKAQVFCSQPLVGKTCGSNIAKESYKEKSPVNSIFLYFFNRYFRKDNYFGLSCFQNIHVDSEAERGARMKSVGILSTSYTALYKHMQFLENQVRHQLEIPGRYGQLLAFYNDRKGSLPSIESSRDTLSVSSPMTGSSGPTPITTPSSEYLPSMKITHPAGCFAQFINFFGEQIFVLWKYILLRKRILFFSPPPIGVVCYRGNDQIGILIDH